MITDTVAAWQIEAGDLITLGGDDTFTVAEQDDRENTVTLTLRNDDGDCETFYFSWDEDITLVVSIDEDDPEEVDSFS